MPRQKSSPSITALQIAFLAITQFCLVSWSQTSPTNIRAVNFKNFTYPWVEPDGWPDHLQWMNLHLEDHVQLINGKWDQRKESEKSADLPFSGMTLEGVAYTRLSGERTDDAIVVLRYDTGGTQNHYWVYIFGESGEKPKLLGYFHAGDRAAQGLYQVFARNRILNVLLYDPKFREGDCCSTGYLNYRFRWNGNGFEAVGRPLSGRTDAVSRRPVTVFGLPIDQH